MLRINRATLALALSVALPLSMVSLRVIATVVTDAQATDGFWVPALAPSGPLVVVVSIPAQRAYVYRNGVRIGVSPVSTGRPGYDTPPGVYTVLGKEREHRSNLYDNAPMPYMQRLTWDGLALHAGTVPGHPASHGCVRLPRSFAERLFAITTPGTTVVIADRNAPVPTIAPPGLFAPVDPVGKPQQQTPAQAEYTWQPERATSGPITIVLSTHDRQVVVLRNGVWIGQATISLRDPSPTGTSAYVLLAGRLAEPSRIVPGRNRLRWLRIPLPQDATAGDDSEDALAGSMAVPPAFALDVYDTLVPGATVVVTDEALQPTPSHSTPLMQSELGSQ